MPLTDTHIKTVKYAGKPKKHFDGGGLFLFVSSSSKLWRMAYRFEQKEKLLSFGEYPIVSLKDARERREEAKKMLANGIDPAENKKSVKAALLSETNDTFQNIALEWHKTRTAEFSEKHRGTMMFRLETYLFPAIGKVHISKLEPQDILAVVRPIEQKGLFETSRRLLQIASQIFRYAVITGRAKHNITADLRGALRPAKSLIGLRSKERKKSASFYGIATITTAISPSSAHYALLRWFSCGLPNFAPQNGANSTLRPKSGVSLPSA